MFAPMLAESAPATDETIDRLTGTHYFDLKIDGVRGTIAINDGKVTIWNRNGVDITYRYPEIAAAASMQERIVLDGEIVVFHEGRPSFRHTAKRDRQQKPASIAALSKTLPATFVAFDVLYSGRDDLRNKPWSERMSQLTSWLNTYGNDRIVPNVGGMDGRLLLDLVREHQLEGLVAKRLTSRYQAGRHSDWVKVKPTKTCSCVVTGMTPGTGWRAAYFGALTLVVFDPEGNKIGVGEVGSGFKQVDLEELVPLLLDQSTPLIVEVEYQERTADGKLRFPVYRGVRTDLSPADCILAQFDEHRIQEQPA